MIVSAAAAGNAGSGVISPGTVVTPGDSNKYQISFTSATTYDINQWNPATSAYDIPTIPPVVGATYTSGSAISVGGGGRIEISGAPAAGDTFTVQPSSNVDMFKTLGDLITQLEKPIQSGAATSAQLSNSVNTAIQNFDQSLQNVLTVRASVGSRMNEVDSVKSTGEDLQLQYEQTISNLRDVDYAKAITDLTRQKATLEAAQLSFTKVQGLSLFNFM